MNTLDIVSLLYDRVTRNWQEDDDFLPSILPDEAWDSSIVGSLSIYNPRTRASFCRRVPGWIDVPVSPSAVAREVLAQALKKTGKKRFQSNKNSDHLQDCSHPLFFSPYCGEIIYIDLRAAYFSIYKRLPVHFFFNGENLTGGRHFLRESFPSDWSDYKLARNSLVGLFHSKHQTRIRNKTLRRYQINPPTFSPSHWGFIQLCLHWIAEMALEYGAKYAYIDGFIFPLSANWQGFQQLLADYGFDSQIKAEGEGRIIGVGRYQIGDTSTVITTPTAPLDKIIKGCKMDEKLEKIERLSLKLEKN